MNYCSVDATQTFINMKNTVNKIREFITLFSYFNLILYMKKITHRNLICLDTKIQKNPLIFQKL